MILQIEALKRVLEFLDRNQIRYMVIGGIANAIYGRPRVTLDADLKISTGELGLKEVRRRAEAEFKPFHRPWLGEHESRHIIALEVMPDMVVDLLVALFPYEEIAIERATLVEYEGLSIRTCTAEDLIIHKAISNRLKDWLDIEGIIRRQKDRLDVKYVRQWLRQWDTEMEPPID